MAGLLLSALVFAGVYHMLSVLLAGRLGFPREPRARIRGTVVASGVFLTLNLGLQAAG